MEFTKLYKTRILAKENLYKSVISINENIEEEEKSKDKDYLTFGVKNTSDIPLTIVRKIKDNPKYLFTTVDKMSHLGRSIDTDLHNPLTYRLMTGSSSGTCINILKGINDFGIGTDGGGSVLAPALSTNLYSFIGAGMKLVTEKESLSTDSISFNGSMGIISKDFKTLKTVTEDILNEKIIYDDKIIRVLIPKTNNLILPDNIDMRYELNKIISKFKEKTIKFIEYNFDNIYSREVGISEIKNIFNKDIADVILTLEGPIDIYGYDETIQRSFKGSTEIELTSKGGKALVKAANMCKCTGITIPSEKLASGYVILGKEGIEGFNKTFKVAEEIEKHIEKNEIFQRYFIERKKFVNPLIY
ncbi:amidase family protein [Clostridium sp.]|uniref:amidase family protein n=1 Tax=Clostridium sp. TaxID=1506 RepID=UPI00260E3155|nr:amidase family protein [Clostridium sp.]